MPSIKIRQLKEQTNQIMRRVRDEGKFFEITYHGHVIARLVPVNQPDVPAKDTAAIWTDLDQLAAEIGQLWPDDVSAAAAVSEGRREL